ncbi:MULTISPECIES: YugN family protein [Gracilibacillus]|uniref:YugN family protein n=1 Tax=Gracilibacillus TaxID=74385 RepID=UPI0008240FFB|nr:MULTISPECIES: YugN family protein [Gracilibacillus]
MFPLESTVTDRTFDYQKAKGILEGQGFSLGGSWDYQHGSFDYKLANDDGYHFLRIPFRAIRGEVEQDAVIVIDSPFILTHRYQNDNDSTAESGVLQASFNQFQTPIDKDGDIPSKYVEHAKVVLNNMETLLS